MSELFNSLTSILPNVMAVAGTITQPASGTTFTLANLTGNADFEQAQVTLTRNSAGSYTVAVTNFQGPAGTAIALCAANTTAQSIIAQPGAVTYSGATASVTFQATSTGLTDVSVNFLILAY